jgi:DNA-binding FadR family transcriptional regulator
MQKNGEGDMVEKLQRATLAEQAEQGLLTFIKQQGLQAGATLPAETALASAFGVSRQVIREALKALQGQGVIEILNGKGAVVRSLDSTPLVHFFQRAVYLDQRTTIELIEVRKGIEVQSAMLAAQRRTPAELARLQALVDDMGRHVGEPERYSALDLELHLAIAAATHNAMLTYLISSMREVSRDTIKAGLEHRHGREQLARVQELHQLLLDEIQRGNADGAGQMMALQFDEAILAMTNAEPSAGQ